MYYLYILNVPYKVQYSIDYTDRGALLESICRLRSKMDRIIFLFTPSHKGVAPNAYADAAAKSHLQSPCESDTHITAQVQSRPCLYRMCSDFDEQGQLQPMNAQAESVWISWDRALFKTVRKRSARWIHMQMTGSQQHTLLDATFIGRRGHKNESPSYVHLTPL